MRNPILQLIIFMFFSIVTAQAQKNEVNGATNVLKATFLNPGVGYEHAIGKNHTLAFQAFMNFSFLVYEDVYGDAAETVVYFDPAFSAQYRYYYNFEKRAGDGKRTAMNSGNYVGAVYEGIFSKLPLNDSYLEEEKARLVSRFGAIWGFQRNYRKRFSLDLNLGVGYITAKSTRYDFLLNQRTSNNKGDVTIIGQFNIGFWLNKQRN